MILDNPEYKEFKRIESYSLPFPEESLDRSALLAAVIILQELISKSFGIDTESGFQGVVLRSDITGIESQLKEKLSKMGVDVPVRK